MLITKVIIIILPKLSKSVLEVRYLATATDASSENWSSLSH